MTNQEDIKKAFIVSMSPHLSKVAEDLRSGKVLAMAVVAVLDDGSVSHATGVTSQPFTLLGVLNYSATKLSASMAAAEEAASHLFQEGGTRQ